MDPNKPVTLFKLDEIQDRIDATVNHLRSICARTLPGLELHHIGSTSIPGAITKGDVDMLVQVDPALFEDTRRLLDSVFAHNPEMTPEPDFVSYSGAFAGTDFGIQLTMTGDTEYRFIDLREKMRENPDLVEKYNETKRNADRSSMDSYRESKSAFIEALLDD